MPGALIPEARRAGDELAPFVNFPKTRRRNFHEKSLQSGCERGLQRI